MEYFADDELAELLAGSLETAELTQTGFRNAGAGGGSPEGRYVRWLSIRDQAKSVIEDVWRIRSIRSLIPRSRSTGTFMM